MSKGPLYTDLFTRSVVLRVARRVQDTHKRVLDEIAKDVLQENAYAGNCDACCLPTYESRHAKLDALVTCDSEHCESHELFFCTTRPYYCKAHSSHRKCTKCSHFCCEHCRIVCDACNDVRCGDEYCGQWWTKCFSCKKDLCDGALCGKSPSPMDTRTFCQTCFEEREQRKRHKK